MEEKIKDFEKLEFEGKIYHIIGCVNCSKDKWIIASDGSNFVCSCANCGHRTILKRESLRDKPNEWIESRFFS